MTSTKPTLKHWPDRGKVGRWLVWITVNVILEVTTGNI